MNSDTVIVTFTAALNSALSLVVLVRNPRKPQNITFSLFGASITLWAVFNYLADHSAENNLLYTRLTVVFGSLIAASLLWLSFQFPKEIKTSASARTRMALLVAANALLCMSSLCVKSVDKTASGVELQVGIGYAIFVGYIISFVAMTMINFRRQYHGAPRIARSQIKLMVTGIFVYSACAILANILLPLVVDSWTSSKYGPLATVPFVAITSYAIIKHRLFDIRSIVARITAYVITLGIITTLYSLVLTTIIARMVSLGTISAAQIVALAVPTLLSALTFPYVKHTVDRLTTRIFFQNPYETRAVLAELSDKLMSNDMEKIIQHSIHILSKTLLPSSIHLVVLDNGKVFAEARHGDHTHDDIQPYIKPLEENHGTIFARDYKSLGAKASDAMHTNGHDVILRLGNSQRLVGFVCFGDKKSGSIYSSQDMQLLQIVSRTLSVALENAKKYEQIQNFANTLKEEVAHATSRLKHANERLKTLDELKDDFISMASHQFRTPAGSIRQALHMINDPDIEEEDRREMLKLAEANSEQLTTIVATMLSISRLQAGRFVLDKSLTDLSRLIDTVLGTTSILAEQKNITLHVDKPDDKVWLNIDAPKIKEAMTNYIENAIKYSPPGSKVSITLKPDDRNVTFEVTDQGMGVPEENRKQLFNKFYRAANARQQHPEGNGIGLYVVKSIAELHGGKVYYKPGEPGSIFGFTLPAPSNSSKRSKPVGEYKPLAQTATIIE